MDHYPANVPTKASRFTIDSVKRYKSQHVAEIGCNKGATSLELARLLAQHEGSSLHLFDYTAKVDLVINQIRNNGFQRVHGYPVSAALHDSYNWNLMHLIRQGVWKFDYVFIDGAHTWNIDALAFLLIDRLLGVGGFVEFDDYDWCIEKSPTLSPRVFPMSDALYTPEQRKSRQIALIVDLLVKTDPRYTVVVANRLFRKIAL